MVDNKAGVLEGMLSSVCRILGETEHPGQEQLCGILKEGRVASRYPSSLGSQELIFLFLVCRRGRIKCHTT